MRGAKLITVNCNHCNRKIHATIKQFLDGMDCPACGMPVTPGNEEQISATNSFMSKTTCVNCRNCFDISIADSFKFLALCPKCNSLFVRDNFIMDELLGDQDDELLQILKYIYPAGAGDQGTEGAMASSNEIKFLSDLNIKVNNPSSRMVQRVAKTVFNEVNVAVLTKYNSILYFPGELRAKIYMGVAQSPLFSKIYFGDGVYGEELEAVVKSSLGDDEIFRALSSSFDTASIEIAVTYIRTYAKLIFEKELDEGTARIMALRSFARGWGHSIRHCGYFVYSHGEHKVRSITKLSMAAMRSFYTRHNPVNNGIEAMLTDKGWQRPASGGCLGLIVAAGALGYLVCHW